MLSSRRDLSSHDAVLARPKLFSSTRQNSSEASGQAAYARESDS